MLKKRVSTLTEDSYVWAKLITNFRMDVSDVNVLSQSNVRSDVEAPKKRLYLSACASLR